MFTPTISSATAPVWEHCRRAIDHAGKLGLHQLPLIGTCDWNDGMNLVGAEGRGESVWLGWFLITVLESFAQLMDNRGAEVPLTSRWRRQAASLKTALEHSGWDGDWYTRAYFDDGSPLGSHVNQEAQNRFPAPIFGLSFPVRPIRPEPGARWNRQRSTWFASATNW